ncbi:MAG TPA: MOSC domain-containing protein [Gammaproteobacteria bacterium]|nr:MOSC domain-containing protein [Gammaproteobacteria bacterium]
MSETRYPTYAELEAQLETFRAAPRDGGRVELIVRRPTSGAREILSSARLDTDEGLVGDRWFAKPNRERKEQLTVMCARVIAAFAGSRERWPLAGDQLFVDLDLSTANLPPGTRLAVGTAVIEVSTEPHLGCKKFRERYGLDAMRFAGSDTGRSLQLRGVNATVIVAGEVALGDRLRKL